MMYRMTVDYVTSTTVLVEADGTLEAERAVYAYLKTDEGLDYMLEAVHENPNRHWSAFEVAEAAVVREAFARYLGGESIYGIADSLAARGWITSKGRPVNYNWVQRILGRKAYTGLYSWGGIEVEGGMPVIIDDETFKKVPYVPKKKPRERENWSKFRMSGKLYCGECGEPMHGNGGTGKSGKRYYYYMCKEKGGCKRRVSRGLVEDAIAGAALAIASDESAMRSVARRAVEAYASGDAHAERVSIEALPELRRRRVQFPRRGREPLRGPRLLR